MRRRESIRHAKQQVAIAIAEALSSVSLVTLDFQLSSAESFDDMPVVRVEARVRVEHPQYEDVAVWESVSFDLSMSEVQG